MPQVTSVFDCADRLQLTVLGDVMLDTYTWGSVDRISPEAPVPVLRVDHREQRLGGAASVAGLLRGFGCNVRLVGLAGIDGPGVAVRALLTDAGIDHSGVCFDEDVQTTVKERLIGVTGNSQAHQMLRIDSEDCRPPAREELLIAGLGLQLEGCQALLISDYGKGACTPGLLRHAIDSGNRRNIPILIDPARNAEYSRYAGATVIVPNRREASTAYGMSIDSLEAAACAGRLLCEGTGAHSVVVKLDADGMLLVAALGAARHFPALKREVSDVTGAGDMVLAALGLALAAGQPLESAIELANVAAGLEVERTGVVAISPAAIRREFVNSRQSEPEKLVSFDELIDIVDEQRRAGRRIVFTNGCFDLLHLGHVTCLKEAARQGDLLVVAINSDDTVRRLKGPSRPVIGEQARAHLVASLDCVDYVVLFSEPTPCDLLHRLRPDVLVKGGDYEVEEVVGREIVESYGGLVHVTGRLGTISTTSVMAAIQREQGQQQHSPDRPDCTTN